MNNKMTFRFDHSQGRKRGSERSVKEESKVIPLHVDEYKVVEPPAKDDDAILIKEWATPSMQETPAPAADDTNGSKQPAKPVLVDAQPLNLYTTDYGGWQSSFDTETNRVERIIRESGGRNTDMETGYMRQPDDQDSSDPHRDEPTEPLRDHRWYVPEEPVYITHPRKPATSWIKIATSVAGAIVTGIAFGFFVLSMFSSDSTDKGSNVVPPGQNSTAGTAQTQGAVSGQQGANAGVAAPVTAQSGTAAASAVNIPAKTYSFLQGGVFSTVQSADAAIADLKKKGFTGVRDSTDKFPVYVGMTMTRDEALGLTEKFKQSNVEVLVKNVELPAVTKMKWNGKASDALPNYIVQGDKLLQSMTPLTVQQLSVSKPAALDAAALQSVKTAHQTWTGLSSAASEGLAEDAKAAIQKMNQAMNTAVVSLDEFKKNAAPSLMWQAQSSLMQYVVAEKELRKAISVQ
ncbi:hypothetical protein DVH26_27415 [Paenibacillus sp. H1-7]|uniref:SPOR domain-containing protein n=1 Tax=Paenibacillus sp. H1-7 TaxID=2282849 RepID=UPI001EF99269|nr:hypothetical protein [Paenibacillus sp. H1-7]ULL17860.1 hypothetical protein DVH26_27415 [Paenibacillus sp. H1-7]